MKSFLTACTSCGGTTSKSYARKHTGQCKSCSEPDAQRQESYRGPKCPQCDGPISKFKADHHYVCEACTKQNDPMGYAMEVRGF